MRIAALCLATLLLWGCGEQPQDDSPPAEAQPEAPANEELTRWYREKAAEDKRTLSIRARAFHEAVNGLLQSPQPQRLATARQAWRGLYQAWNHALVALYCRAQLHVDTARRLRRSDPLPILPGYIDGLSQWPDSGIVNDVTLTITREELLAQQGATAEGEASLGFQVIHFLLHGEPGHERTAASFTPVSEAPEDAVVKVEQLPDNRRRRYLKEATAILTEDLQAMASGQTPLVTPGMLLESLRLLTQRLIRLENLALATDVAGDYLAPTVREQALEALKESLHAWTGPDTPLMTALERHEVNKTALRTALDAVRQQADTESLQALHAELAAVNDQLRANR